MPAVTLTPENAFASAETLAKIEAVKKPLPPDGDFKYLSASERLNAYLRPPDGYSYPLEFDHLGRSMGMHSYVAVVHADGDGLGTRLRNFTRRLRQQPKNEFVRAFRGYSMAIDRASRIALEQMAGQLTGIIETSGDRSRGILHFGPAVDPIDLTLHWDKETQTWHLPFRPIVFGGDDITFAADGRIGLAMVKAYMDAFEKTSAIELRDYDGKATASAGVCIVKTHYPFARAYALAEELAASAKSYRRSLLRSNQEVTGCLDWHFANSGLTGDLSAIRKKTLELESDQLLYLRPVTLDRNPVPGHGHRSWQTIDEALADFQNPDSEWGRRRSKMKQLMSALRMGEAAVQTFRRANPDLLLPVLSLEDETENGWMPLREETRCLYYDALELVDWYISFSKNDRKSTMARSL